MKKNSSDNKLTTGGVIVRIMKESGGILHWILLATALSIGSAYLAMTAPEILGNLVNRIFDLTDRGVAIDMSAFYRQIITLALIYLLSAALRALTVAVMNYSVSNFFTCRLRVKMSEKIAKIPIKTVRANAAYVPQDNFLFSDTIENNISFATDGGNHDDVELAAKLADVHDNIAEFPEQYGSVLGERGVTVSGGQKQRISIARALMKNASILILDDSVSAVDVKTEKAILENLRNTRRGKTTLLIAHRVSTIEQMDKIIFVDEGKIAAVGKYDELYLTCQDFKNLVDLQKLDDADNSQESSEIKKEVSENA